MEAGPQGIINWSHLQAQLRAAVNRDKLAKWCQEMAFSLEACDWLGVGYLAAKKAWTFPERDAHGQIVGIACRHERGGRKWMIEGSTHGLFFAPDPDWGGVPKYLDHPILVVEGATDVLAALSREIYAVGKPSATGTTDSNAYLMDLCRDRDVALVSENDKGVGAVAYLDFFKRLGPVAASVKAIDPPLNVKDLREWFKASNDAHLEIEDQLRHKAPWSGEAFAFVAGDVLLDTAPLRVADAVLLERYNLRGSCTLRYWAGIWFRYDGTHYEQLDPDYIRADVYEFLDGKKIIEWEGKGDDRKAVEKPYNPTMGKVTIILDAIKARPQVLVPPTTAMPCWLDQRSSRPDPQDMVCFANGILHIRDWIRGKPRFLPPDPEWFSQSYCPYTFDPSKIEQGRPFINYLQQILNGDEATVMLLQEWLGYCMVNDTSQEKFLLMIGRPSAGKGTVMDVFTEVIGRSNIYFSRIEQIGSRFGLYGALGRGNIFLPDAHATNMERAQTFLETLKTITGRGAIDVEGKNMNVKSMLLWSRFTISVNEMPNFHDAAAALRRRLLVAWFPNSYEGRNDPTLKARLTRPEIIEGVAVWAMEGYRRLRLQGRFTEPGVSKVIAREFERTNTPVSAFCMEECVIGINECVSKDELYQRWINWSREKGMSPGNLSSFGQKLLACNPTLTTVRMSRDNKRYMAYQGIRIRTVNDPEPT